MSKLSYKCHLSYRYRMHNAPRPVLIACHYILTFDIFLANEFRHTFGVCLHIMTASQYCSYFDIAFGKICLSRFCFLGMKSCLCCAVVSTYPCRITPWRTQYEWLRHSVLRWASKTEGLAVFFANFKPDRKSLVDPQALWQQLSRLL